MLQDDSSVFMGKNLRRVILLYLFITFHSLMVYCSYVHVCQRRRRWQRMLKAKDTRRAIAFSALPTRPVVQNNNLNGGWMKSRHCDYAQQRSMLPWTHRKVGSRRTTALHCSI